MGSVGDCFDTAVAERFFATSETKLIDERPGLCFWDRGQAQSMIFDYIEGFYVPILCIQLWFSHRRPSMKLVVPSDRVNEQHTSLELKGCDQAVHYLECLALTETFSLIY